MTTYYIDYANGSDSNAGTSEAAPRKTLNSGANGDVFRLARGTVQPLTGQQGLGNRQGIVITDYGNPAAPKPIIEAIHTTASSTFNHIGDVIWHNVKLRNINRTTSETTASNTGQNAIVLNARGGGAYGTVEGVSGVFIGVDFENIGNNAISFAGINAETQGAFASPVGLVLGCSFDGLGGDGVFGNVRDYLEVGWCTFRDLGTRIEPIITGTPPGGRQSASDAVGLGSVCPTLTWVHDCYIDHSTWDCKHGIMLDAPASQAGNLAIIERNIMLGFGSDPAAPFVQSVNNVGVNSQIRTIMRQNYVRGSRIALFIDAQSPWSDVYSNIFECAGYDGFSPFISMFGDSGSFRHNTVLARTRGGATGLFVSDQADRTLVSGNLFQGLAVGVSMNAPAQVGYGRNAFADCGVAYATGATPLAADATDIVDAAPIVQPGLFTASDARLTFKQTDRRVPDFWGRFSSDGIAHIGACLGAF